jgi:Flp pilus assembly pilin Flp
LDSALGALSLSAVCGARPRVPFFVERAGDIMIDLFPKLRGLSTDEGGEDIVEYALLAAFIAIVAAAILIQMAPLIQGIYQRLLDFLAQA